jgi:spore germination protein GerM
MSEDSERTEGRRERPPTAPIIIGLLLVGAVAAVLWFGHPVPNPNLEPPAPPVYPPGTQRVTLKLYFASLDGLALGPEPRQVLQPPQVCDQMAEALRELIAGPASEHLARVLPEGTTLRQVFLTPQGTVFVNFGPEIAQKHPGGVGAELLSVYGVVETLERNFPQVRQVAIMVDGKELTTLAGHVEINQPLAPRSDLIMMEGKTAPSPAPEPEGQKS